MAGLAGERNTLKGTGGNGRAWGDLRVRALAGAFPFAIAALNRAGLGSFNADISTDELRRAGLRAMGEVAARLDLGDAHVIFGHTHRAGPRPYDAAAEWRGPSGARLINAGCWTYDSYFVTVNPGESPYWPGGSGSRGREWTPRAAASVGRPTRRRDSSHSRREARRQALHPDAYSSVSDARVWRGCSTSW